MISEGQVRSAAAALVEAGDRHCRMQPLSSSIPDMDVTDAYRVALAVTRSRIARGDVVHGYKIGLTSAAAQEMAGIGEPDYGVVLRSMVQPAGGTLDIGGLFAPAAEPEFGFVLKERLTGPGADAAAVWRATEYVVPCLEIVDSRFNGPIALVDTIADNASAGLLIPGAARLEPDPDRIRQAWASLVVNGTEITRGHATAVMGDPATAVAWLANKLSEFSTPLEPGQLVLSGSLTMFVPFKAGDTVAARFEGFETVHFTAMRCQR